MQFIIMHQTVSSHDAIGNDIEIMYKIIKENFFCKVYAENKLNDTVEYINPEELMDKLALEETVVIYHHSVYWKAGEQLLELCRGKIVFKYHNITPESFFEKYNNFHYEQCRKGRKQTENLIKKYKSAFWISDSKFNEEDLDMVPQDRKRICPPFNKIYDWAKIMPDEETLKDLLFSDTVNLLFVSRIAPNKGHLTLLEILRIYCLNYGDNIRLNIIGKFDGGLPFYNQEIKESIEKERLQDYVRFIGEINDNILLAYYLGSDFYINASEHEGFCVPVLEAQALGLPVLSNNITAVPETMGDNQIILEDNPKKMAAAINILYNNQDDYDYLIKWGTENYESRFRYNIVKKIFLDCLNVITGEKQ